MASRVFNPFRAAPRHRFVSRVVTTAREPGFVPRHCAGANDFDITCFHDHPGDPHVWRDFPADPWGPVGDLPVDVLLTGLGEAAAGSASEFVLDERTEMWGSA